MSIVRPKNSWETTMWIDPIVEESRRIRDEHARRFNDDLAAICADLKRFEATLPGAPFAPPEE